MAQSDGETLVLSRDDVSDLIDLPTAIDVTREALREQARGAAVEQPPTHLDLRERASLRTVRGALLDSRRTGVRVTGAHDLAGPSGAALLFETERADLLSVMAYPFGTLRTAAVIGVAVDVLAAPSAGIVTLIGTGRNALGLLEAAALVRPVTEVRVFGRNKQRRDEFVALAKKALTAEVTGFADLTQALDGAQVVIVSTNSTVPVVERADVGPDVLVAGMGVPSEFPDDLYLEADSVVVSSKAHEKGFDEVWHGTLRNTLVDLDADGRLPWGSVAQLSDLVDAAAPPRTGLRVFRESAGGYGDIALASYVYEQALSRGRGHRVRFS